MELFRKRRLSLILCVMLVAFSFSARLDTTALLAVSIISALLFCSFILFRKLLKSKTAILSVASAAVLISFIFGAAWQASFFPRDYYEREVCITGRLSEVDHTLPSYSTLTLDTYTVDGVEASYKIEITGSKDELSRAARGNVVSLFVTLKPIENGSDASYYIAKGFSARGENPTDLYVKYDTYTKQK